MQSTMKLVMSANFSFPALATAWNISTTAGSSSQFSTASLYSPGMRRNDHVDHRHNIFCFSAERFFSLTILAWSAPEFYTMTVIGRPTASHNANVPSLLKTYDVYGSSST